MSKLLISAAVAMLALGCQSNPVAAPRTASEPTAESAAAPVATAPTPSDTARDETATDDTATAIPAAAPRTRGPFDRDGFAVFEREGRLWVFPAGSEEAAQFEAGDEPSKTVTRVTPTRTYRSTEDQHVLAYVAQRPGFATQVVDRRIWVFRAGSAALAQFVETGDPSQRYTLVNAGPLGMTVMSADRATLDEYLAWRPGFAVRLHDGRRWIFEEGSADLAAFDAGEEPSKTVTRPRPGMTLRAVDADVLDRYEVAREGFATFLDGDRVWVFREGSAELADFRARGDQVPQVERAGAGPGDRTVVAPDEATLSLYLQGLP